MSAPINISKLDKAEVLAALFNNSFEQGLGAVHAWLTRYRAGRQALTVEEARRLLKEQYHFDYLFGRVLKVDLRGDTLNPRLYDRDNGEGAAQRAIDSISKQ